MYPHSIPLSSELIDQAASGGMIPDALILCYLMGGGLALFLWGAGALLFGRASRPARFVMRDLQTRRAKEMALVDDLSASGVRLRSAEVCRESDNVAQPSERRRVAAAS